MSCYFDDHAVAEILGAIIRQAATDYAAGWSVTKGDQLDPVPFLEAAGLIDRVPAIIHAERSHKQLARGRYRNKPLTGSWGRPIR